MRMTHCLGTVVAYRRVARPPDLDSRSPGHPRVTLALHPPAPAPGRGPAMSAAEPTSATTATRAPAVVKAIPGYVRAYIRGPGGHERFARQAG
jgi:hypothetical protein